MGICSGGGDVIEDGEFIAGIVTRMVTGVERMAGLGLGVVAGLGGGGVEVVWLKDLWVVVVLEKIKVMMEFW